MLNRNIFFIYSLLLAFFASSAPLIARDYSGNIWNGIRFNKADNTPFFDASMIPPSGQGGGAVAVDPVTMRLLFYTDGTNVYDATHAVMPGGTLNGDPNLNQAAVVVPDPGSPGRYIIYTNTGSGIEVSIVDMNQPGNAMTGQVPLGSIISVNQSTGVTNASGSMAVFSTGTPPVYYLIYQNTTTNELVIHQVGPSGVLGPPVATSPLPAGFDASNISMLELPDGTFKIAVAPSTNNDISLFSFDPASNALASTGSVAGSAGPNGIYDTEWSSDGRYLYFSKDLTATEGQVYQFDTQNPSNPLTAILPTPVSSSYGLQRGPDNQIYHIYENSGGTLQVGRINNPDSVATAIVYDPAPLGTTPFNSRQFSSYLPGQSQPISIDFTYTDPACQNSVITFFPYWDTEPAPSEFLWIFPDTLSTDINPSYTFDQPGSFPVTLIVRRGNDYDTAVQVINVIANDLTLDLGTDTVICPGETLVLDVGNEIAAAAVPPITWNDGGIHNTPTGQSIEVDTTGTYWVTVTLNNGCKMYDARQVELYGDQFQRMNFWYFGNQAGIDFNPDPVDPLPSRPVLDGEMTAPEGSATISDVNGDLLLYTNGQELWGVNRITGAHEMIDPDIGGSPNAAQSAIIVPHPGDETLYYIFTVESADNPGADNVINLTYTLVDIKGGTAGEVIEKNVPLFSPSSERITAVELNDGYVLLAHEMGSNTFWVFPITPDGIGQPVLSSVGSEHSLFEDGNAEGYMEFSPDGTKIAVALSGPDNTVEIFDFDSNDLTVGNPYTVTFDEPYDEYQAYGLEFSSGMTKLVVTLVGNSGSVMYEVRIDSADQNYMQNTIAEVYSGPEKLGAIQRGPNGQIHVAVDGAGRLGALTITDDTVAVSSFSLNGHELGGRTSTLGLPNVVQSFALGPMEPGIMVSGALCVGSTITFTASTTSSIDEVSWSLTLNGRAIMVPSPTEEEFEMQLDTAGNYQAVLRVTNRCGLDTVLTHDFQIFDNPAPPTLDGVSVLCIGSSGGATLDAIDDNRPGLENYLYQWSTGEVTRTIEVSRTGNYSVTITDGNGCTAFAETQVVDSSPTVDLGTDQVVCQFDTVADLNSNVPTPLLSDFDISWQINGSPVTITPPDLPNTLPVNTSVAGSFNYKVEVLDKLSNCTATDSILITVNAQPDLVTSSDPAACGGSDGSLNIEPPNPGYTFQWFDNSGAAVADPANVSAGTYRIEITDPATGCAHTKTQTVDNDPAGFTISSASENPECDGGSISFSLNGSLVDPVDVTYSIYDQATNDLVLTQTLSMSAAPYQATTSLVPRGDYILEVNVVGCLQTTPVTISGSPQTTFSARINNSCSSSGELEVYNISGANPIVNWTLPDGSNMQGLIIGSLTQSGEYIATVASDGQCPGRDTLTLQLINPPVASLPSAEGCDGTVLAVAEPADAIRYEWTIENVSNTVITTTPEYFFNTPGTRDVTVRVIDANGCSDDATATFHVYPEVMVQLSSPVACEDDNPVVLTATGNQAGLQYDWYVDNAIQQTSPTYTVPSLFENRLIKVVARIGQCTAEASTTIIRRPYTPVEGLLAAYNFCSKESNFVPFDINPSNISAFDSYVWRDVVSGNDIFVNSPLRADVGTEGEFLGLFTNPYSCITEFGVALNDQCLPIVYVPNAFSPNNDGQNDTFFIFPKYIQQFEIFIFSRWGELVYYSNQMDFEWDGTFNGKPMPVGTYPYLMRYRSLEDPNRGLVEQRGGVLLLR